MRTFISLLFLASIVLLSFTNSEKDYSLARVPIIQGKYYFRNVEPLNPYEVAFSFKVKGMAFTEQELMGTAKQYADKVSLEKKLAYDALIITSGAQYDIAIKWK